MFEKLKTWSEMTVEKRYNFLLGLIIVVLAAVILKQHSDCIGMQMVFRAEAKELQSSLDDQKDSHLMYLREMDKEYRELLRELNTIRDEKNNN